MTKHDDFRALLLGTWIAIALLAHTLPDRTIRDELVQTLADAAAMASDQRGTALSAVKLLIEALAGDSVPGGELEKRRAR